MIRPSRLAPLCLTLLAVAVTGCASNNAPRDPGEPVALKERRGQEIMVAGRLFNAGTPVVLMDDAGGYPASPDHYGRRKGVEDPNNLAEVRDSVDQFVYHFDVCGLSKVCYKVLEDRGLSVHFMCDADGTLYQSADLSARTWHATTSNGRSIGIEIAQIGTTEKDASDLAAAWYKKDANGDTYLSVPDRLGDPQFKNPPADGEPLRPARQGLFEGEINGSQYRQRDFTPQQYDALIHLTAALHEVFPEMALDYPRGDDGTVLMHQLTKDQLAVYHGLLGHWHVQDNKNDPGPAFDWEKVRVGATELVAPDGGVGRPTTRPTTRPAERVARR